MTNTKLFLLIGTSLSFLPQTLNAQCVSPIQDCYALGYTQTSCPNGKGVKCPFGSGWYCGGTAAQDCIKLGYDKDCTGTEESGNGETCNGKYQSCNCATNYTWNGSSCTLSCSSSYKYTCTGTGYNGGKGTACGGKYTSCTCSNGYEWKSGKCQQKAPDYSLCKIGTLFYSDETCSDDKLSNKTLLGVVVYEKTDSENGWVMTINPIATNIAWSTEYTTTGVTDKTAGASCTNTATLAAKGNKYPAATKADNYNFGGKKWCLPSYDVLNKINNAINLTKVNTGITTAGGKPLGKGAYTAGSYSEKIWLSCEHYSNNAWNFFNTENDFFGITSDDKSDASATNTVRPVFAF